MSDEWRGVLAVLVNPRLRRMLAEIIIETDPPLTAPERRDARRILEDKGMLTPALQLDERRLRELLVAARDDHDTGVDRWLRPDGRIDSWPKGAADRLELLGWVLERLLGSGEVLTEKQLTQRLAAFTADPNTLRRALVDATLLTRNTDGSDYRRP
ncbi:hypothetical protein BH11ACT3_BH11ACT3_08140 [soil metagenome]